MSSQLLAFTPSPPQSRLQKTTHVVSERIYIPSHVYQHPSAALLDLCTSRKEILQVIPLIVKSGLYDEHLFQTKLLSLFCQHTCLDDAARVFEPIENKLDVLYHTMLKGYAKNSALDAALSFFVRMRNDGVRPVIYNFTYLLKACGDGANLKRGKEIHGHLICSGFASDLFSMTAVVNMYAKCSLVHDAYKMFERMPERDLTCWNTIISGYAKNGMLMKALELVSKMREEGHRPDSVTIVSILPAVADGLWLQVGKSVHGYVIRAGYESLVNVSTALLDMYAKCGSVATARLIFDLMSHKTVVSWNAMIDGYVQNGYPEDAIYMFQKMLDQGVEPTNVSIMGALHACADLGDLEHGMFIHKLLEQLKLDSDISVMNSLISMYSKCKRVDIAAKIFEDIQGKATLVSWNAMILGYAQNGRVNEALRCFHDLQSLNIKPDSFTMVSVIPALAELSVTRQAKWIHGIAIRSCLDSDVYVMTALIDMYAKCGAIDTARKLFDAMDERHVITWNAMIDGYGTHGHGRAALELFSEMERRMVKPNDITFLCIISACGHSGLVEEGLHYFYRMKDYYGIQPAMDHYGALVDLLGRAGQLKKAWEFIENMTAKPEVSVYGAMLNACKIHKNVELGEKTAAKLLELNPNDAGYYVLLANIYATASMWEDVAKVRVMMERKGLQKTPGCSLVELGNEVHTFYSGSTSHPESKEIYAYMETLLDRIKAVGYVPDTSSIHDVEYDVKEQLLNSHSERLAIAFGLLKTKPGTTIHIRKNLRVCGDCHSATKYISLVTGREIIVRDMNRFHHFRNGTCSCGDYW